MNPCQQWHDQQWHDQMWLALDGELDDGASATLVAHVRGCSACRDELNRAIRVHRAVLMDAVGVTGAATAPTVALRAVRAPAVGAPVVRAPSVGAPAIAPRVKRSRMPHSVRIARRRVNGNRFVMPVAVAVAVMIIMLILIGPGMTRVVPVATPTLNLSSPQVVTVSSSNHAPLGATVARQAVARLVLAVGVRVNGQSAVSGSAVLEDVPVVVDGSARLLLNDGTTMQLASGTQLSLHRGGQRRGGGNSGVQVRLVMGTLDAEVTPQRAEAPLVVTSPVADVTVVGTAFQVHHDATGSRIQVTHGRVRVAADGILERLLGAGESLTIPGVVPARALGSFVVTEKMNHDGSVPQWCDQLALDPRKPIMAVLSAGEQPPHYKVVNGHPALCLDGKTTSLTLPLSMWDASAGMTVFIVAHFTGTGSEGIERLFAVSDATGERLAVVRSQALFGIATAGTTVLEVDATSAQVLTCTWSRDGAVTLLHGHRVVASASGTVPDSLTDAVLDIARGPQGKHFQGNVFALEVLQGVPTEADMHQRIDELMNRFGVCP